MTLQELFDKWTEIRKQNSGNHTAGNEQERIAEELNVLEALRIHGCTTIPGETSDIKSLINDRHRQMEAVLRKRKE
jgi:hypothetical protein